MEHKSKNDIYWKSEMTTQIKEITTEQRDRIFKNSSHSMYSNNFKIHRQKKKKQTQFIKLEDLGETF